MKNGVKALALKAMFDFIIRSAQSEEFSGVADMFAFQLGDKSG